MSNLAKSIPNHQHLAVSESATSADLRDSLSEILIQSTAQLSAIHTATSMGIEEGGGGPSPQVVNDAIWGIFRQLDLASKLLRELP